MNFQANNIDLLYVQICNIYDYFKECDENVKPSLESIISDIKKHWDGEDSNAYLNDIVNVYKKFDTVIDYSISNIHKISISVVKALAIKERKDSLIDSILPVKESSTANIDVDSNSVDMYADNDALRNDYNSLVKTYEEANNNYEKIINVIEDFEKNWIYGTEKEESISKLDQIKSLYKDVIKDWEGAIKRLDVSIANLNALV